MSRAVATLGGIGRLRPAPGTWGSAVAIPAAWVLHVLGGFPLVLAATAAAFVLGLWAVSRAIEGSVDKDPAEIVIDELVGQWIALWPLSWGLWLAGSSAFPWPGWVAAFALFRLFDIWKPGPVGWADRRPGVWGVMLDDVAAGLLAAIGVATLAWLAHTVMRL